MAHFLRFYDADSSSAAASNNPIAAIIATLLGVILRPSIGEPGLCCGASLAMVSVFSCRLRCGYPNHLWALPYRTCRRLCLTLFTVSGRYQYDTHLNRQLSGVHHE